MADETSGRRGGFDVNGGSVESSGDIVSGDKIIINPSSPSGSSRKSSNSKWVVVLLAAAITAAATILAAFITTCYGPQQSPTSFSVTPRSQSSSFIKIAGHVRADDSGAAIPNAKVSLDYGKDQPVQYSDSNGDFAFQIAENSAVVTASLRVEKGGYYTYDDHNMSVHNLDTLDIRLKLAFPTSVAANTQSVNTNTVTPTLLPTTMATPSPTVVPTSTPTVIPTTSSDTVTMIFEILDPKIWAPPTDPEIIFVRDGALHIRLTSKQVADGKTSSLSLLDRGSPIRDIAWTMTMLSFARSGEGGVSLRAFMSDGRDNSMSLTHDKTNAAIEMALCKKTPCENYDDSEHPEPLIVKERTPVHMRIAWDGELITLYADGVPRGATAASNTPINDLRFDLFANNGGAFEVTVDDLSITYGHP